MKAYLDNAATTKVDEKAIKNVEEILQNLLKDIMSAKK